MLSLFVSLLQAFFVKLKLNLPYIAVGQAQIRGGGGNFFFLFVCIILQPLGAPTYGINVSYLGIVKDVSSQYPSPTYIYINAALVLYGS